MPNRVTLKQVALKANVSYQTVSKVINRQVQVTPETEERIWQAVNDLGYSPNYTARSLRSQLTRTIGYSWAREHRGQTNPILDEFLQSMFHAAELHGYYLLSFPWHDDPTRRVESYRELIDTGRVDGFILSGIEYNDARIAFLMDRNFPFVAFGRSNPHLLFPSVDVDGGAGVFEATRHLISIGHHKIAALAWPETSRVGTNRLEGYFRAMQDSGLEIHPQWIMRGEMLYDFGLEATCQLLRLPENIRPTAVITMNDMMAVGAMQAVQQSGLVVGKDLAITGFDDNPISRFVTPPLTTVRQPIWEVGERIITMLITRLTTGHFHDPISTLVTPELVVRASSTGQFDPVLKCAH